MNKPGEPYPINGLQRQPELASDGGGQVRNAHLMTGSVTIAHFHRGTQNIDRLLQGFPQFVICLFQLFVSRLKLLHDLPLSVDPFQFGFQFPHFKRFCDIIRSSGANDFLVGIVGGMPGHDDEMQLRQGFLGLHHQLHAVFALHANV